MTPEEFGASFETVAEAPGGIKKLRQVILDLASRGCLVQQIEGDKSIGAGVTVQIPDPGLPLGWKKVELQHLVSDLQNGVSKRRGEHGAAIPVLRLADIKQGQLRESDLREIMLTSGEAEKYKVRHGDILAIRVNGSADLVGRFIPCASARILAYSDHLIRVRVLPEMLDFRYLCLFGGTTDARKHLSDKSVTTAGQRTINQVGLGSLLVSVPPLAEQKRIVAKVDQLMALCDELESRQAKKRETAVRLNRAALDALTTAEGPEEIAASFRRVAENFEVLFDRSESVEGLRKAILDLAIHGQLVRHILSNVESLVTPTPFSQTSHSEKHELQHRDNSTVAFEIPRGWSWEKLANVVDPAYPISYGVLVPGPEVNDGIPFVRIQDLNAQKPTVAPAKRISADVEAQYARTRLVGGELLLGVVGSIGKLGIVPDTWKGANIARAVCRIMPYSLTIEGDYLKLFLQSNFAQKYFVEATRTLAQPTLNVGAIRETPVPVPPLAEQARIVAKVDQLMALCDTLEAALRRAESTAQKLAEAVVAELVA